VVIILTRKKNPTEWILHTMPPFLYKTKAELLEYDIRNICAHEAGHAIVGRHFGYWIEPSVWLNDEDCDNDRESLVLGQCMTFCSMKPFQECCIGYAGGISQEMLAGRGIKHCETLRKCLARRGYLKISSEDLIWINAHRHQWRAAKTAWQILKRNRDTVEREAEALAQTLEESIVEFAQKHWEFALAA
jgi:hypothetical protein